MTISGHHHLNVTDVEAHKRFFVDTLGGAPSPSRPRPTRSSGFPNALIFLREQAPTGGTKGTTVNHFAFGVPNIRQMVDRVKAAGWPMATRAETPPTQEVKDDLAFMVDQQTDVAFMMAPDETKIEFIEIPRQTAPIALHHIHFLTPQVAEMKAWYVNVFDARPGKRGNFEAADMPGVNLTYSPSPTPVVGTRGRALDHIGFEIANLEAFCRRLARARRRARPAVRARTRTSMSARVPHRSVGDAHIGLDGGAWTRCSRIMRVHLDYGVDGLDVDLPDERVTVIEPRARPALRGPARRPDRRAARAARPAAAARHRPTRTDGRDFGLRRDARAAAPRDARGDLRGAAAAVAGRGHDSDRDRHASHQHAGGDREDARRRHRAAAIASSITTAATRRRSSRSAPRRPACRCS